MPMNPFRPSLGAATILATYLTGCSPPPGTGMTDDVIEIEEIEMTPQATEPAPPESGAEARREVDAEKAAADQAIDEAGQSIEPPPAAPPAKAPTPPADATPPEASVDQ